MKQCSKTNGHLTFTISSKRPLPLFLLVKQPSPRRIPVREREQKCTFWKQSFGLRPTCRTSRCRLCSSATLLPALPLLKLPKRPLSLRSCSSRSDFGCNGSGRSAARARCCSGGCGRAGAHGPDSLPRSPRLQDARGTATPSRGFNVSTRQEPYSSVLLKSFP